MKEIWKNVLGYEGVYKVSNLGRVKSLNRYQYIHKGNGYFAKYRGRIIKPRIHKRGYLYLTLNNSGKRETVTVHKIVAEAFLGKRPDNLTVNHIDMNRQNNKIENLEYVTLIENVLMSYKNNPNRGTKRILDEIQVLTIHTCKDIISQKELSRHYNVGTSCINSIINHKRNYTLKRIFE